MNKALETVEAVHTSQFLNYRNAIAVSYESATFCVNVVCVEMIVSVLGCALNFVSYIEDS